MQLSDEFIAKMKKRARRNPMPEDAVIYDLCGGNFDDAYSLGIDDGESSAYQSVLAELGIAWEE